MLPVLASDAKSGISRSTRRLLLFAAGRLFSYLMFGFAFGLAGGVLGRSSRLGAIMPYAHLFLGLLMVLYATVHSFPHWGFCRLLGPQLGTGRYALILGMVTGLNLCPPFLLAATAAAELGRPLSGLLFFLAFFVGTSVWLLPLAFTGLVNRFEPVRVAGRILAAMAGLWFAWHGIATLR